MLLLRSLLSRTLMHGVGMKPLLNRNTSTLKDVLTIDLSIGNKQQFVIYTVNEYSLHSIKFGWVEKHVTLICSSVKDLTCSFTRENNDVLVILNDITNTRSTAHRGSIEVVNIIYINCIN